MVLNIVDNIINKQKIIFSNLCKPAQIEYIIGIIGIISLSISCLTDSSNSKISDVCTDLLPYIATVSIATYILNALCKGGASIVSWFMIILPIVMIIISIYSKKKPEYFDIVDNLLKDVKEEYAENDKDYQETRYDKAYDDIEHFISTKPELKMFLYPKKNMETDEDNDRAEVILPEGKNFKKITESDIDAAGIDSKKIRSIQKHDDIIFILYINSNCTGNRQIYSENQHAINSRWENKIGSIYLFRKNYFDKWSKDPVQVYEKPEYEGKSTKLWILPNEKQARYNKSALEFVGINNNEISSLKNPKKKWIIKAYKADNFVGKYTLYDEDEFTLGKKMNNKITSIKITRNMS